MKYSPWIDEISLKELDKITSSAIYPFDIFEWGCGGSTLWFAIKNIGHVYSIEHNPEWHKKIMEEILNSRMTNVSLQLVSPIFEKGCMHSSPLPNMNFDSYTNAIKLVGKLFDLIMVDGRARTMCFNNAIPYIKDGGYLILHDSERYRYNDCRRIAVAQKFTIKEIVERTSTLICQKSNGIVR